MIANFEYKIPRNFNESFEMIIECVDQQSGWELVQADAQAGVIEWYQQEWLGLWSTKVRAYLREPRPKDTLVTIYMNRPLLPVDPFKTCQKLYLKIAAKFDQKVRDRQP